MPANFELARPSSAPMFWGYATGTFASPTIREGGVTKKWVNENDRHEYIEEPIPSGQQNWGSMDARGELRNNIQRAVSHKGGMAFSNSTLLVKWKPTPQGQTITYPWMSLEYEIENKCDVSNAEPTISAHGHGAVSGHVTRDIKRINPDPDTTYNVLLRIKMESDFQHREDMVVAPATAGRMRYRDSGGSSVDAKWIPTLGAIDSWVIIQKTRRLDGTFYERTYTYPGYELSRVFACYGPVVGDRPLTFDATVGRQGYPQGSTGQWEEIVADNNSTVMESAAYPEGTSGAEPIRDELWTGKIHVAITGTVGGEGVLSP